MKKQNNQVRSHSYVISTKKIIVTVFYFENVGLEIKSKYFNLNLIFSV